MKKLISSTAIIFIFCFVAQTSFAKPVKLDGVTLSDPTAVTSNEVSSWTSNSIGVSDELMKAFFDKESKLLGNIGDALSVIGIGKQVYEDDDWGALTSTTLFVVKNIFSSAFPETMGKANLILVAIDAYVVAVNLVKKYFFIPSMIEGVYKYYKEHRVAGIAEFNLNEAEKVFNIIGNKGKINTVVTEMKKQIAKEKYGFNEKGMTTRFKLKVQDEARKLLIAQMEQRYQKERIPEMMKVASDKAKEKRGSYVNKVKDKLEMPIRGVVVDAETSKKIEGAKVGVKRKSYAVYTRANGSFYLDVPYRLVEGRSFHIYAVGKEYEGEYSQQITWKETKIPPRIRFELNAVVDELDNLRNEYCEKVGIVGLMTKEACLTQVMAAEKVGCKRDGLSEEECKKNLIELYKALKKLEKEIGEQYLEKRGIFSEVFEKPEGGDYLNL